MKSTFGFGYNKENSLSGLSAYCSKANDACKLVTNIPPMPQSVADVNVSVKINFSSTKRTEVSSRMILAQQFSLYQEVMRLQKAFELLS